MKTTTGTLIKTKKGFVVGLVSKKGKTTHHPIPLQAQYFRNEDAKDGMEVDVELDDQHRVSKVTIPGTTPTNPPPPKRNSFPSPPNTWSRPKASSRRFQKPEAAGQFSGGSRPIADLPKASPEIIGLPFHNPYTFLPFPKEPALRTAPTPLSLDELPEERSNRFTGVLELEVTTKSPLLTCDPEPVDKDAEHKTHRALQIGPDVILPATGVRGALRSLLTIITGASLGHLDQHAYLCQGRDNNLGPAGPESPEGTPLKPFLGEVVKTGTALRPGVIRLGETRLIELEVLEQRYGKKLPRGKDAPQLWVELDGAGNPVSIDKSPQSNKAFKLKVSGRPIKLRGKREGAFRGTGQEVDLPPKIWAAYSSRNSNGDRPILKKGDLVWLEPSRPDLQNIQAPGDIQSIQWARWGREGQPLQEQLPPSVWPDYMRDDGRVNPVTNLFGQVSPQRPTRQAPAFAARVRPENLVFLDAVSRLDRHVTLAPLVRPHPGCIAFYRDGAGPDTIAGGREAMLRGYKVYRTTLERGAAAPWRYENQGVYGERGELQRKRQKLNKTCDLLREESRGHLRIAFRALTVRELALLMQLCALPWRLGGGKPLGLGLCEVKVVNLLDEFGETLAVPGWSTGPDSTGVFAVEGWQPIVEDLSHRVNMWIASQRPVSKLRYPRAVEDNQYRKQRGGHVWFQRHAAPRKTTKEGTRVPGLEPLHIDGELLRKTTDSGQRVDSKLPMIAAQALPRFDPEAPDADLLYGYDAIDSSAKRDNPTRRVFSNLEEFSPQKHVTGREKSEGSHGKDANFRAAQKRNRGD